MIQKCLNCKKLWALCRCLPVAPGPAIKIVPLFPCPSTNCGHRAESYNRLRDHFAKEHVCGRCKADKHNKCRGADCPCKICNRLLDQVLKHAGFGGRR